MNFEDLTKPNISTENNVAQNTLWLHCVFSNYGCKTKFQIGYSLKYLCYLSMAIVEIEVSWYYWS